MGGGRLTGTGVMAEVSMPEGAASPPASPILSSFDTLVSAAAGYLGEGIGAVNAEAPGVLIGPSKRFTRQAHARF